MIRTAVLAITITIITLWNSTKTYQASAILLLMMNSGNKSSISAARHNIVLLSFCFCSKVPLVDSLTSKSVRLLDDCSCLSVFFFFWCVQGSPYYDNVRPLCYSDSDAVLLCFDISRPDTVDSSLKKVRSLACGCRVWTYFCYLLSCLFLCPQWKTEILDFCPSTRILLIGCKTDLRTDVCTLMELSNQKQTPVTYEQVSTRRRGANG